MDIQVAAAASIPTPASGYRTLFVNTDTGLLTFKYDDGTLHLFSDVDGDAECCACLISKDYTDGILCALKSGMLKASDFQALINLGFTANVTETDDGAGNKTCNVTLGSNASAVVDPSALGIIPNVVSFSHLSNQQYYGQFTPLNTTDQGINWISSDPTKATVNSSGLVTGVAAGTIRLYAYSQANNTIVGTKDITLT